MKEFNCKRCEHKWYPRKEGKPKVCPKCHTPYWNVEKKVKQ